MICNAGPVKGNEYKEAAFKTLAANGLLRENLYSLREMQYFNTEIFRNRYLQKWSSGVRLLKTHHSFCHSESPFNLNTQLVCRRYSVPVSY